MLGSTGPLGSWEAKRAVTLTETATPQWEVKVSSAFRHTMKGLFHFVLLPFCCQCHSMYTYVRLLWQLGCILQVVVDVEAFPVSYKYAIKTAEGCFELEDGPNRSATLEAGSLAFCRSQYAAQFDS